MSSIRIEDCELGGGTPRAPRLGCASAADRVPSALEENTDVGNYGRFGLMIATSTLVMFGLMYLNTYEADHVRYSETRTYMALLMGAAMAVVMLAFMHGMYPRKRVNLAIFAGSALVFAVALWLVRSQETVQDVSYMRAMIPHHSIAILTSTRAEISDPRVRALADEIIASQRREIAEMEALIADLQAR
jgi:FlaA1/EpsC-like NDP-sugar epimerase